MTLAAALLLKLQLAGALPKSMDMALGCAVRQQRCVTDRSSRREVVGGADKGGVAAGGRVDGVRREV